MKRTMHSAAPLLAALALLLAAAPATAQRKGGEDIPTGDRQTAEVSGRVPGSPKDKGVNWIFSDEGDGYGVPFMLPYERSGSIVAISALALANNTSSSISTFTPLTNAHRYGTLTGKVVVSGGAAAGPWSVKVLGSDDFTTYQTLFNAPTSNFWLTGDTLKVRGHGPTGSAGVTFPIALRSGGLIRHQQLAVIASNDSTLGGTQTITVTLGGTNP